MKILRKISASIVLGIILFLGIGFFTLANAQSDALAAEPKYEIPELQVKIPGLTFSNVTCSNKTGGAFICSVSWIGDYVAGIYEYALGIGGVLAAVMLMAGGVFWLVSGGDASRVSKAKTLITGSITGLVILFASYVLLFQINPDLTIFKPIQIRNIDKNESVYQGSDSDDNSAPGECLTDAQLVPINTIDNVRVSGASDPRLSQKSYDALKKAAELAKAQGVGLTVTSANRTYQKQLELWNQALRDYGSADIAKKYVADPVKCKAPTCAGHCGAVAVDLCITGTSDCGKLNKANAAMTNNTTKQLESIMNSAGWGRYCGEWWHFQTNLPANPCK